MVEKGKVILLSNEFTDQTTGEHVEGITVLIDGDLKHGMDIIFDHTSDYASYLELVHDALFKGLLIIVDEKVRKVSKQGADC